MLNKLTPENFSKLCGSIAAQLQRVRPVCPVPLVKSLPVSIAAVALNSPLPLLSLSRSRLFAKAELHLLFTVEYSSTLI